MTGSYDVILQIVGNVLSQKCLLVVVPDCENVLCMSILLVHCLRGECRVNASIQFFMIKSRFGQCQMLDERAER